MSPFRLGTLCLLLLSIHANAWPASTPTTDTVRPDPSGTEEKQEVKAATSLDAKADPADTIRLIETRLKELESASGIDTETSKRLIELYRKSLSNLEAVRTQEAKSAAFANSLETAPAEIQNLREEILALQAGTEEMPSPPPSDMPLADLEQQLAKAVADETSLSAGISETEKTLEDWSQSQATVRQGIQDTRKALDAIGKEEAAQPAPENETAPMKEARLLEQETRQRALRAELLKLERELLSQGVREDLLKAKRDKALLEIKQIQGRAQILENAMNERRLEAANQAKREAEAATRAAAGRHPLVVALAATNADFTAKLAEAAGALSKLNDELTQTRAQAKRVEEEYKNNRQRMEISGLTDVMGQVLMDSRQHLPDPDDMKRANREREQRIAAAGLQQIRFNEDLQRLRDLDVQVEEQLKPLAPAEVTAELRNEVRAQLERRRELLTQVQTANQSYLRLLGEIDFASQELLRTLSAYQDFLARHLLWTRSAPPLGSEALTEIPHALEWLLAPLHWREIGQVLLHEMMQSQYFWLAVLPLTWLLTRGRAIRRTLVTGAERLRRVQTDRFRFTLEALALTALLALGWPLLLASLGWRLDDSVAATPFSKGVGSALIAISPGLYALRFYTLLCMPGGVADRHYRWTGAVLQRIRTHFTWAATILVPLSFTVALLFTDPKASYGMGLQRLSLVALMLVLALFLGRLLHPQRGILANYLDSHPQGWLYRLRLLWYPGTLALPLGLAILALLGFVYTAAVLLESLVAQLWLILALVILQQTILRWLEVTRRHLALRAALDQEAERDEQEPRYGDHPTHTERRPELANLDEQTRHLLNAIIFVGALLGLGAIWSEVTPAFTRLQDISLWTYMGMVNGTEQLKSFSLASLAFILATIVLATIAVRNLPALLEILLLQRFSVSAGARYAIKTLTAYSLIAIAILLVSDTLGISWGRVQWLVAALGVGIGFGLQEIVANFISGIIILFERPVRVGDVVTIGQTTGTVTKIRIRATTVRNWDRQELLVPNKEFITGHLLNWTLSDSLNRIVIRLGIDYGNEVRTALHLMAQAVDENPRVLRDPEPSYVLEGFGDNAIMLQARCFVAEVENRVPVTSDLQQSILDKFRANGISLAFPQREIHLHTSEPLEVRLRQVSGTGLAQGPAPS